MRWIPLFLRRMKRLLSYLLILLFSIQALPVKELGKLLLKKAAIEQTADESEENGAAKEVKEIEVEKAYLQSGVLIFHRLIANDLIRIALHQLSLSAITYYPDITTPPPDQAALQA